MANYKTFAPTVDEKDDLIIFGNWSEAALRRELVRQAALASQPLRDRPLLAARCVAGTAKVGSGASPLEFPISL
jgi:hypothetical protein